MAIVTKGQIAYEAYSKQAGGKSLATGWPLPSWFQLNVAVKDAWEAAAKAVLAEVPMQIAMSTKAELITVEDLAGIAECLERGAALKDAGLNGWIVCEKSRTMLGKLIAKGVLVSVGTYVNTEVRVPKGS